MSGVSGPPARRPVPASHCGGNHPSGHRDRGQPCSSSRISFERSNTNGWRSVSAATKAVARPSRGVGDAVRPARDRPRVRREPGRCRRVMDERLAPGVQDGEEADLGAEVPGVGGGRAQRLGDGRRGGRRMTRRPSLRSESRCGPCGPAWTGASRPSTTSRRTRDEQSARGLLTCGSGGAAEAANAGVSWLGRPFELGPTHPHLFQETRKFLVPGRGLVEGECLTANCERPAVVGK